MKGLFLFILSIVSFCLVAPIAILYSIKRNRVNFKHYAISIDQTINAIAGDVLSDLLLIDKSIFRFGDMDKTISYNIGKNKHFNNLNRFGRLIDWALEKIDRDHTNKAYNKGV